MVIRQPQLERDQRSVEARARKSDDAIGAVNAEARVARTAMVVLCATRLLSERAVLAMPLPPVARFIAAVKVVAGVTGGAVVLLSTVLLRMDFAVCALAGPRVARPAE